jgi:hypothetical protein
MSEAPAAPAEEASAGLLLRRAREAAGLHVAALAVSLKVPVRKLEALEDDRYDLLPDAVFARALASSVCRTLKIDPQPVLRSLAAHRRAAPGRACGGINAPFRAPGEGTSRNGKSSSSGRWRWSSSPCCWRAGADPVAGVATKRPRVAAPPEPGPPAGARLRFRSPPPPRQRRSGRQRRDTAVVSQDVPHATTRRPRSRFVRADGDARRVRAGDRRGCGAVACGRRAPSRAASAPVASGLVMFRPVRRPGSR